MESAEVLQNIISTQQLWLGGAVVFDVVINGFAGYVLSKLKPRGVKFVYWLVIVLMLLPATHEYSAALYDVS